MCLEDREVQGLAVARTLLPNFRGQVGTIGVHLG